ncbi:hypothetical protein AX16_005150 [Volvariella volvacea WC 439]|nr:hypothetical protein AX16_005150 [Volvariella volvacea WC 439]
MSSLFQVPYDANTKPLVQTHLATFIARRAMYDGDDRPHADECHPDTRQEVIDDITGWALVQGNDTMHNVLWVRGPVGTGKTTLARTVASNFDKQNLLVGDFFFLRTDKLRNHILNVIPTLAYRLCIKIPQFGTVVERMLAHNVQILNAPLEEQWENLILRPLAESSPYQFAGRPLIVIDGIDECTSTEDQDTLLRFVSVLANKSPFTFLLTSRLDPHIDASMRKLIEDNPQIFRQSITLGNSDDARKDIATIVTEEMSLGSPDPRLLTEVVDLVSRRSAGQFSYAIEATAYLRRALPSFHSQPQDVLDSPSMQNIAFPVLDNKYNFILRKATNSVPDATALHFALFHLCNIRSDSVKTISALWDQEEDHVRSSLSLLQSVLDLPLDNSTAIKLYHPSFQEYLSNPERSKEYFPLLSIDHLRRAFKKSLEWAGHSTQFDGLPELVSSLWLDFAPKLDAGLALQELSKFNFKKWTKIWYANQQDTENTDESYEAFRQWLEKASSKKSLLEKYNKNALSRVKNRKVDDPKVRDRAPAQGWAKRLSNMLHISRIKYQIQQIAPNLPRRMFSVR